MSDKPCCMTWEDWYATPSGTIERLRRELAAARALLAEAVLNEMWCPVLHLDTTLAEKTLTFHREEWLRRARAAGGGE